MASPVVALDDFLRDWAVNEGEVLHSEVAAGFDHKAKKAKTNTTDSVPASTRKLKAILQRVKCDSEMKLYQFVSYDKYDSLVYFPHNVARCYTSGNSYAYEKLLLRHYSRCCQTTYSELSIIRRPNRSPIALTVTRATDIAVPEILNIFALSLEAHPDCVFYILSTRVVANQIYSTMLYSYTDTPEMYITAPTDNTNYPYINVPQAGSRAAVLAKQHKICNLPPFMQHQLMAIFESQDVLTFNVKLHLVYTFKLCRTLYKIVDVQCTVVETTVLQKGISYWLS